MAEAVPVSPFPGGLHVLALTQRKRHAAQWAAFGVIALFAMGNAVAMIKRAERLAH